MGPFEKKFFWSLLLQILIHADFKDFSRNSKKTTKIGDSLESEFAADRPKFVFLKNYKNVSQHTPGIVSSYQIPTAYKTFKIILYFQWPNFFFLSFVFVNTSLFAKYIVNSNWATEATFICF